MDFLFFIFILSLLFNLLHLHLLLMQVHLLLVHYLIKIIRR